MIMNNIDDEWQVVEHDLYVHEDDIKNDSNDNNILEEQKELIIKLRNEILSYQIELKNKNHDLKNKENDIKDKENKIISLELMNKKQQNRLKRLEYLLQYKDNLSTNTLKRKNKLNNKLCSKYGITRNGATKNRSPNTQYIIKKKATAGRTR